jgi:hypothetical protein
MQDHRQWWRTVAKDLPEDYQHQRRGQLHLHLHQNPLRVSSNINFMIWKIDLTFFKFILDEESEPSAPPSKPAPKPAPEPAPGK